MYESRATIIKKKPKIILDNVRFPITESLNLGDRGQLLMQAEIDAERLEFQEDGNEREIKTVRAISIKLLDNKTARI